MIDADMPAQRPRTCALSPGLFRQVAAIARDEAGLTIAEAKAPMVEARLSRRLRALGLPDFTAYLAVLEGPAGAEERRELVSALTTNVTHFFRERHHFDLLRSQVLPGLVARARAGGRARIWSAGCSTGQEPFSIAAEVMRAAPDAAALDIRILATDIDRRVLSVARTARYPVETLAGLTTEDLSLMAGARGHCPGDALEICADLRGLVVFRELNLLSRWPMRTAFDAIFCRNVVIYFDTATQRRLWPRFEAALSPGAWLFLGHSERLHEDSAPGLCGAGVTTYRRRGGALPKEV